MAKSNNNRLNITTVQKKYLFRILGIKSIDELDEVILKKLKENLKKLTDKRQKNKTSYKIWDIVMYVIIASFSNVYDWEDIEIFVESKRSWLKKFLQMTGGIPSAQTIERVFSLIEPKELESILTNFFLSIIHTNTKERDTINLDGRVDCGSGRKETDYNEKIKPLNVLNAYSNKYGICLASEMIEDKTNEIPAIPDILKRLNIKDTVVTWDALNTQKENIKAVVSKGGDYVAPIKGNHPAFYSDLILYFDEERLETIIAGNSESAYLKYLEQSHSSIIKYEYFLTTDTDWYHDKESWEKLNTIGYLRKTITKNNEDKVENNYYISSLHLDMKEFSKSARIHWSVENKLHFHLDFTFKEDSNKTTNKNALLNLQIINKFVLATLDRVKPYYNNRSLKKIRTIISNDFDKQFINLLCYLMLT